MKKLGPLSKDIAFGAVIAFCIVQGALLVSMIAPETAEAAVHPSGYIATTFYPIRETVSTTEGSYTVPDNGKSTHLLLVNDGNENIFLAFADRAVDTDTDFFLKPNESVQLPISIRTFRFVTTQNTSLLRGGSLK